jgi:hypothetical protein
MAGIAQRRDPATGPALERWSVVQGPDERLVHGGQDGPHMRVPSLEGAQRVAHLATIGPRLAGPRVLLHHRDEVHQLPVADEVVHEVPAGTHPHLGGDLQVEMAQPVRRDQPAVGDAAGEPRPVLAGQQAADGGVDAVGADHHINPRPGAVRELDLDVVPVVGQAGQAVPEMDPPGRDGVGQRGQQVGPVHLVVREAERRLQRLRSPASPSRCRTREAFGLTCTPAPISPRAAACSCTRTSKPARSSDNAALRPPRPAPTPVGPVRLDLRTAGRTGHRAACERKRGRA